MDEPLPVGLGLRVPPPIPSTSPSAAVLLAGPIVHSTVPPPTKINIYEDGLCEFDELDLNQVRISNYSFAKDHPEHLLDEALHCPSHFHFTFGMFNIYVIFQNR